MSKLTIVAVELEIKQNRDNHDLFEVHGLSVDEDRHHWVFNYDNLREIGEWLIAFAGQKTPAIKSGDKTDPRNWEVIVSGPPS